MKKIAVTYSKDDGTVFGHFGQSEWFKVYTIENNEITSSEIVYAGETGGHSALIPFISSLGADTLICGGIGERARDGFSALGITVFPGVEGSADDAVKASLEGTLVFNNEVSCCCHHEGHSCHGA